MNAYVTVVRNLCGASQYVSRVACVHAKIALHSPFLTSLLCLLCRRRSFAFCAMSFPLLATEPPQSRFRPATWRASRSSNRMWPRHASRISLLAAENDRQLPLATAKAKPAPSRNGSHPGGHALTRCQTCSLTHVPQSEGTRDEGGCDMQLCSRFYLSVLGGVGICCRCIRCKRLVGGVQAYLLWCVLRSSALHVRKTLKHRSRLRLWRGRWCFRASCIVTGSQRHAASNQTTNKTHQSMKA